MPWLVTASLSCTLIWRAVSFKCPTRSSSGRTNVPPPTTTLTPLSPETAIAWPFSLRTLAPREPPMMITPTTVRNGVDVAKLGIGPCSFFGSRPHGDGYHLYFVPCGNLDVRGG